MYNLEDLLQPYTMGMETNQYIEINNLKTT